MKTEPAIVLVVIIGSLSFFFLFMPWVIAIGRLREVWRSSRGTGLLLGGVILLTSFFFALFFGVLAVLIHGGVQER